MLTTTRKPANEIEALDSPSACAIESPQAAHPDHSPAVAKSVKPTHTGNAMLTITRKPPTENEPLIATLEGNIDAHAAESLRELYDLPPPSARLDFTGVQRVNSMGLALLLKLFEHCENKGVGIHVVNANRMTSMLFKMTNLDRYLGEGGKAGAASPAQKTTRTIQKQVAPAAEVRAPAEPAADRSARAPSARQAPAQPVPLNRAEQAAPPASVGVQGKLVFLANMQNSQQLNGWYFFNTYLQRRLGRDIHLDLVHAAWDNELQPSATHLVFAQPFQATRLLLQHGFHLVARPADQADEITVLVRADDARQSLSDFAGGKAVTDTAESFVYLLGRFLLDEGGLASEGLEYIFTGHEIKAVRTLLNGDADILFLPTENYNSLSALTRSRLRPLDASDSGLAFHLFCLSPACADLLPGLRETLLDMSTADKGKQVLDDLGLTSWSEPEREEIDMLTMLYQRYVG
jgi:anti-anti-sigma factor